MMAKPVGVALGTVLPQTKTDQNGKYQFENLVWLGQYVVFAEDLEAGYSDFANGPASAGPFPQATLSPEHPEAELNLRLPPRAGFLEVHLTNRKTGASISGLQVNVTMSDDPSRTIFSISTDSANPILLPPQKDLLIHIWSFGFNEWMESVGRGKPVRIAPGVHRQMDVRLDRQEPNQR